MKKAIFRAITRRGKYVTFYLRDDGSVIMKYRSGGSRRWNDQRYFTEEGLSSLRMAIISDWNFLEVEEVCDE